MKPKPRGLHPIYAVYTVCSRVSAIAETQRERKKTAAPVLRHGHFSSTIAAYTALSVRVCVCAQFLHI